MTSTKVYFATNRVASLGDYGFSDEIIAADAPLTWAVADVSGIDIANPDSGGVDRYAVESADKLAGMIRDDVVLGKRNLLIFVHGFDNSFDDAIERAAYVREFYAQSGVQGADCVVVTFTWPSSGLVLEKLPAPPQAAYLRDQAIAAQSGEHLATFLKAMAALLPSMPADRRATLLVHSMGNVAFAQAVYTVGGTWNAPPFDDVVLAAPDVANTVLDLPVDPMFRLPVLAKCVSVYFSRRDLILDVSSGINGNARLGQHGPSHADRASFPADKFRMVDCTEARDFPSLTPIDATHQYYRRSRLVRDDLARVIAGLPVLGGETAIGHQPLPAARTVA